MGGDLVGQDVLAGDRQMRGVIEHAPGAGDPLLGVDHDVGDQPRASQRREPEHGRRRVAAGVGDDARTRDPLAVQLAQPVHSFIQQVRPRVLAIPLLVRGQRPESEVGAEIDDARAALAQRAHRRRRRPRAGRRRPPRRWARSDRGRAPRSPAARGTADIGDPGGRPTSERPLTVDAARSPDGARAGARPARPRSPVAPATISTRAEPGANCCVAVTVQPRSSPPDAPRAQRRCARAAAPRPRR